MVAFVDGRIVILGFGSIGSGLLPLLLNRFRPTQIVVLGGDERNMHIAQQYGVTHLIQPLDVNNYQTVLAQHVRTGDFLVNVSVNVSSLALMEWCAQRGSLYIDTCVEPWQGYYTDLSIPPARRSNYSLRQDVLDRRAQMAPGGATAIMAHGANPGLVSHFVKRALLHVSDKLGMSEACPSDQSQWISLAQSVGLKVIHIAERDTQTSAFPKRVGEFVNTWSVDGFISEGLQPSEMGWGSHEKALPVDGNVFDWGCGAAIWLNRPGCVTRVRSWTPQEGAYHGWIITHNESISIADYFTSSDGYRPTVHYAYHPCDGAVLSMHELAGKNYKEQTTKRLLMEDVVMGVDELGVLLMGDFGAYWYGSLLDINTARRLAPHNNATSLQVVAPIYAAIQWAIRNPFRGIVESDQIPHEEILEITDPYMGQLVGSWTDWTPLQDRNTLFEEDLDWADPWQFKNFRVV
jgi:homospermidine synthase